MHSSDRSWSKVAIALYSARFGFVFAEIWPCKGPLVKGQSIGRQRSRESRGVRTSACAARLSGLAGLDGPGRPGMALEGQGRLGRSLRVLGDVPNTPVE